MQVRSTPRARIIKEIPIGRVDLTLGDQKSVPHVGDIVELDQGFTMPSGEPAGIVVCRDSSGSVRWVADVLESEIEMVS
jgi:hypothetical protein